MVLLLCSPAYSLGKVSRACDFADIPEVLKAPALIFFGYLGMPDALKDLSTRSIDEQHHYFILESLTTDYGSLRYYLFAENKIYTNNTLRNGFIETYNYRSPWAAQSLDPAIFNDSRLNVFGFNRKVLFSARAGHPEIIQYIPDRTYLPNFPARDGLPYQQFRVVGRHYYYDPATPAQGMVGDGNTDITGSCNLSEWGLEDR